MKINELYVALSGEKTKVIKKFGEPGKVISFGGNYNGTFVNLVLDSGTSVILHVHDFEMEDRSMESLRKSLEVLSKGI